MCPPLKYSLFLRLASPQTRSYLALPALIWSARKRSFTSTRAAASRAVNNAWAIASSRRFLRSLHMVAPGGASRVPADQMRTTARSLTSNASGQAAPRKLLAVRSSSLWELSTLTGVHTLVHFLLEGRLSLRPLLA